MRDKPDFFSTQVIEARRFYLDLNPSKTAGLSVVSAGYERCSAEYHMQRRTFPYLSIEFVAEGEGALVLKDHSWRLMPGTVFAYGPGIGHEIRTHPEKPMAKYFVDFSGKQALEIMKQASLGPGNIVQVAAPGVVINAFERLIDDGLNESHFTPELCAAFLRYLFLKIAEVAVPYGLKETQAFLTYQHCRQFIQQHYLTLWSAEQAAEGCQVDLAYLCRLFKRFDHVTPYRYLVRLKMNRAAEMLQQPGKLVKQVAEVLGFSDPYHFSRVFKRVHGLSPEQFIGWCGRGVHR
jgi:AraC-like DNA-binding protein